MFRRAALFPPLLSALLLAAPATAAGVVSVGGAGRIYESVPQVAGVPIRTRVLAGPAVGLGLDFRLSDVDRLGGRVRFYVLLPSVFQLELGVGYRRLFPLHDANPFVGVSLDAGASTECVSDVCGIPGVGGSLEVGLEWPLRPTLSLWVWAAVSSRLGTSPPLTPMPSLWTALSW